jgi:virginiamycin B lyase
MRHRGSLVVMAVLSVVGLAWVYGPGRSPAGGADAEALPGMTTLSGAVAAPKPSKAAPVVDSEDHVWFTVIVGDMIGEWDRQTGKSTVWKVPTQGAAPYGIALDKDENVWFAEFRRCKIGKFDPRTEQFIEYAALTQPCTIRRLGVDSTGTVWYGGFNNGKLGKLDSTTGKIVEYDLPMAHAEPSDVWPDRQDSIRISDGGHGGALIRFDPKTEKYTSYPAPQITEQSKLAITRDGAVWYTPRSSSKAAAGVLYPDVTKITSLGAYE